MESRIINVDLQSGLEELRTTKKRVEKVVSDLIKSADEFTKKAEALSCLSLLRKSNGMRKAAKQKEHNLRDCERRLIRMNFK